MHKRTTSKVLLTEVTEMYVTSVAPLAVARGRMSCEPADWFYHVLTEVPTLVSRERVTSYPIVQGLPHTESIVPAKCILCHNETQQEEDEEMTKGRTNA